MGSLSDLPGGRLSDLSVASRFQIRVIEGTDWLATIVEAKLACTVGAEGPSVLYASFESIAHLWELLGPHPIAVRMAPEAFERVVGLLVRYDPCLPFGEFHLVNGGCLSDADDKRLHAIVRLK